MDEIREKNEITSNMITMILEYREKANPLMVGLEEIQLNISKNIMEYEKLKAPKIIPSTLSDFFVVFEYSSHINEIMNNLYKILKSMKEYPPDYTSNLSETYINDTIALYRGMLREYKTSAKKLHILETSIIIDFIKAISHTIHTEEDIEKINETFYKNIHCVKLYAALMQRLYNSEIQKEKIRSSIEKAKNFVLSIDSKISCSHIDANIPMSTFGLISVAEFTMEEILKKLKIKSFDEAKKREMCIVLFKKIIKNPLMYNISGLLRDADYKEHMGINEIIIGRYKNIIFIPPAETTWDFSIAHYGEINSALHFIFLGTYNNKTFNFLSLRIQEKVISHTRQEAQHIINFINGNVRTRNDMYNAKLFEKMQNNMFLSKSIDMKGIENVSKIHESKYIRTRIFNNMDDTFLKIIKYDYENGETIKSKTDLGDIIFDYRLTDLFSNIIVDEFMKYIKTTGFKEFVSEITATFYTFIFNLYSSLTKEILTLLNKEKVNPQIFSESSSKKILYIHELYTKILKRALNVVITDSSNIYQSALIKYQLMNI